MGRLVKIILVGFFGSVLAVIIIGIVYLICWLIDIEPDFGIMAICLLAVKIMNDMYGPVED